MAEDARITIHFRRLFSKVEFAKMALLLLLVGICYWKVPIVGFISLFIFLLAYLMIRLSKVEFSKRGVYFRTLSKWARHPWHEIGDIYFDEKDKAIFIEVGKQDDDYGFNGIAIPVLWLDMDAEAFLEAIDRIRGHRDNLK